MYKYLRGGLVIDKPQNILIENDLIKEISYEDISVLPEDTEIIDCKGLVILPGIIDVHVHFREPGNTEKADMNSESLAALAGGVTTILDMPNNSPTITTIKAFNEKLLLGKKNMHCNYGFYFGVTNSNIDDCLKIDNSICAGLKLFLGSSTGNMLVDNRQSIEYLFQNAKKIISAHCEDESLIKENKVKYLSIEPLPYNIHSLIRNADVCYNSSSYAVSLAKKYHTNFHIAHITTEKEINLLSDDRLENKFITSEVSPNHLFFSEEDYKEYGNLIKCNPSIKTAKDKKSLRKALKEGFIDIVATDHAPHLKQEKLKQYSAAPSGIPSIQFSLLMMLQIAKEENWDLRLISEKMSTNPAKRFHIAKRGKIKKGYFADLVIIDLNKKTIVNKENILYKCNWSPLEGKTFDSKIVMTFLNGEKVYQNNLINNEAKGDKLYFS